MNNNITLLFQGRINEQLFNMLELYKNRYNIIISTNDINNILFNKIYDYLNNNVILITYNINLLKISKFLETFKYNFFNKLQYIILKIVNRPYKNDNKKYINMYYQTLSTYYGLLNVKTKFVIKFRCDEYYSDIQPLIDNILLNENKVIISDVFIINNYLFPYAISDHIICGKTNLLLKSFKTLKLYFESNIIQNKYNILNNILIITFEQLLGCTLLIELGHKLYFDINHIHKLMYNNFIVIKVSKLGNFIITSNIYNLDFKNDNSFNKGINSLILTKDFEYMNSKNYNYIFIINLIISIIILYYIISYLKKKNNY